MSKNNLYSPTHQVFNQAKPLVNFNVFLSDPILRDMFNDQEQISHLTKIGSKLGSHEMMRHASKAERNRPILKQYDDYGRRIDIVNYDDSYHELMKCGVESGAVGLGFKSQNHILRGALIYMQNQLEPGHCCPLVMTAAAIPVLRRVGAMKPYLEKVLSGKYDPRNLPIEQKDGITIGMSMTEKQGGSDVRANTTLAEKLSPIDNEKIIGKEYAITGHKWFTSAPMSDAYLTLAKTHVDAPPSCFWVPRWLPNGSRNGGFQITRLKDKLADRANASSEVEYRNAWSVMIGEEGKGVKTIIEMVQSTRLDCALGSAATARRSLQYALNHVSERKTFGKALIDQPLMRNVLTDLCIESEASTIMAMHMSHLFHNFYTRFDSISDEEKALFRVAIPISKYFITKRLPNFVYECLECHGGNGFVEDFPMATLFRHSPLNSIWEGSGNVIALDILRSVDCLPSLLNWLNKAKGFDSSFDLHLKSLESSLTEFVTSKDFNKSQMSARNIVDRLAVAIQAFLLIQHGDQVVARAYILSRIGSNDVDKGINMGGNVVFDVHTCDHILDRNRIQPS